MTVVAVVGVASPAVTVLLWSRARRADQARGGTRLTLVLAGQVTAVLLVNAVVCNYVNATTSWSHVWEVHDGRVTVSSYGGPDHAAPGSLQPTLPRGPVSGNLRILGPTDWSPRSQRRTRGVVESVVVTGLGSRLSERGYVYLPPQYFAAADAHHRFPAVEVLTGYPGSTPKLITKLDYPGIALQLVQQHRSVPTVYVMLSSTVAPPRDTECTDVPDGPQAETFLATEVPSAVSTRLHVQAGRWGIIGDSTGGYCATKIIMTQRAGFAAGVSLSGYYFSRSDRTTGSLWGGSIAVRHANDPEWLLTHRPAPPVSLYVTIGRNEKAFDGYPDTMRFLHLVTPPMQVTAVVEPHGRHSLGTWRTELPGALHWLSARLTA